MGRTPSNFASTPNEGSGRAGPRAVRFANAVAIIFSTAAASEKSPITITTIFSGRYHVSQKSVKRSRGAFVITSAKPSGMRRGKSVVPSIASVRATKLR